ncbi:DUF2285 domain-containing protein [Bradyrhizobium sp. Ai1a-2]|uniref:DUF2285 domain-containing protein n=1 Tax=Bradyrhizobium sp. Ai1a-2 TaxID=196490 RepID=UPI002110D3D3|nr:DUF2285 domain-containing protein [Bradyrhizobium sp. Ai1a-2]
MSASCRYSRDQAASRDPVCHDGCGWAWEFLRRNRDYVVEWRRSVPRHLSCVTLNDGTQLLRLPRRFPRAEKWGLHAFAHPGLGLDKAPVFWHANAHKRVVRLNARTPSGDEDEKVYRLSDFKADRCAVVGTDGISRVLLRGRGLHVPLEIRGLQVLTAPFVPVFELRDLGDISNHAELLSRLQRLTEPAPQLGQVLMCTSNERLQHALTALDESLMGKTYRQIAITLFGESKVAEDWQGPSQFLKDRVRRLVAKGNELMKGGYRDLLG